MAFRVMETRNSKSKPSRTEELSDGLTWVGLIFAAVLALMVVIQSTPAIRDALGGGQTEVTAD